MSKFTVSEFVVEIGFDSSKALQGLAQLEKRVNATAVNIEKKLNGAFSRLNGAQKTGDMFKQIQRQADQTSNHIQRALQRGFAVGGISTGLFTRYQEEGVRAANTVRNAMREASSAARPEGGSSRPYTPRPRQGLSGADSIRDITHRQQTSAFYGQMSLRAPETAASYVNRLNGLRDQHLGSGADVQQFRRGLRDLNFEYAQRARAVSQQRAQQRLNAMEGSSVFGKLNGAMGALAVGFMSLQKSVEYFNESLVEGNKRAQARTMLSSAYGTDTQTITTAVNDYANRYGADKATAQHQAAQLRFTLPEKQFTNTDIPKLLETESVFAHTTGMTADGVERFNYALSQIAASAKLMGQDWLQVVNASPALIKPLQKLTSTSDTRQLREKLQTLTGGEVAKLMIKAMEELNNSSGAAAKAMSSMQATQGRYMNAQKDGMERFYNGFSDGFKSLLNALTGIIGDNLDVFEFAGRVLGGVFKTLANVIYYFDTMSMTIRAYMADFGDWLTDFFNGLPEPVQKALKVVGNIIEDFWSRVAERVSKILGIDITPKEGQEGKTPSTMDKLSSRYDDVNLLGAQKAVMTGGIGGLFNYAIGDPLADVFAEKLQGLMAPADNWLREQGKDIGTNWLATTNAPPLPGMKGVPYQAPQNSNVSVKVDTSFKPLTINIPMPDGSTFTTQAQVEQAIDSRFESSIMTAQGLGGSWQIPGESAGFSPSLLQR